MVCCLFFCFFLRGLYYPHWTKVMIMMMMMIIIILIRSTTGSDIIESSTLSLVKLPFFLASSRWNSKIHAQGMIPIRWQKIEGENLRDDTQYKWHLVNGTVRFQIMKSPEEGVSHLANMGIRFFDLELILRLSN